MCTPKNLEHFHLLHCGPVDVAGGVLPLLSPEVHDQLLCFVGVEGEVIFQAPLCQGPHLLPVGRLIIVSTRVAMQSWVNREYTISIHAKKKEASCKIYCHTPLTKTIPK